MRELGKEEAIPCSCAGAGDCAFALCHNEGEGREWGFFLGAQQRGMGLHVIIVEKGNQRKEEKRGKKTRTKK